MKKNIKPENWGNEPRVMAMSVAAPEPNRARIEAKIAEIKEKISSLKK